VVWFSPAAPWDQAIREDRKREEDGMAGDRLSWAGLLKWSLSYVDGAGPSRTIR
jgi:hypothetical protein